MMRALSSGVAGLKAFQTAMDVIGNNIANVNTYGFKASRTTFSDTLYQTLKASTQPGSTVLTGSKTTASGSAGINPTQVGYGSTASSVQMDTGISGMVSTGYGTDAYINGEGFFTVATGTKDASASDKTQIPADYKYTRVGELQFDSDGYLTDGNGNRILGESNAGNGQYTLGVGTTDPTTGVTTVTGGSGKLPDPDTAASIAANLTIPQAEGTTTHLNFIQYDPRLDTLTNVAIASDGTVTATNAAGNVVTVGRVALAYFNNPAGLSQAGGNYYTASNNSGAVKYYQPGDSTGSLTTGALEASNVDLANEFSNMIQTERGFQANSKIITVGDTMLQTLVDMVR